jgi:hypothetical protein
LDDLLSLCHDPDLWMAVSLQQLTMGTYRLLPVYPVLCLFLDYLVVGLHDFSLDPLLLLEWW